MINSQNLWLRSLITAGLVLSALSGQQSSSSSNSGDFFLDLGVVIEPATGKEETDHYIKSPPEKVSFFVDKKPSGSVYMATTKELHETLKRIHEKIEGLETNLHNEMTDLKEENFQRMNNRIALLEKALASQMTTLQTENKELRGMVSDLLAQEAPVTAEAFSPPAVAEAVVPPVPGITLEDETELLPEEDAAMISEVVTFNKMVYMNGVLAYQRGDYGAAVGHFEKLALMELDDITAGNIIYWLAECHFRLNNYREALSLLDRVDVLFESDKRDDAMALTGMVYREIGENDRAQQAFAEIVDFFPESEYLRLAQMELRKEVK